jgi:hypothetical protein
MAQPITGCVVLYNISNPATACGNSPVPNDSLNALPDGRENIQLILYHQQLPAGIRFLIDLQ